MSKRTKAAACGAVLPLRQRLQTLKVQAARRVPKAAIEGFENGRAAGKRFIAHDLAYSAGVGVGFTYGVGEGIVGVIATPARAMFGLAVGLGTIVCRAICQRGRIEGDDGVEVEGA